jgi:hypothetical protein
MLVIAPAKEKLKLMLPKNWENTQASPKLFNRNNPAWN